MKVFVIFFALVALSQAYLLDGSRIVGGDEADPHSFPYQVGLQIPIGDKQAFCGGSIISDQYILSAAHCLDKAESVTVVLGAHKINEIESTQKRYNATEIIVHKGWNPLYLTSDIALIKLPEKIEFNEIIQPVALPCYSDFERDLAGKLGTVSGWGKDSDKATTVSPVLRYVQSEIITEKKCKRFYFGSTGKNHVCMSGKKGKSSCSGDSGGPLVIQREDGRVVQEGLVSFGIAFGCEIGYPSAYTKVSAFLQWINQQTNINVCN